MQDTFYRLLRIALSLEDSAGFECTTEEWKELFQVATKQGVVGICFRGVQSMNTLAVYRLPDQGNWQMPKSLYIDWMSASASVQAKNDKMEKSVVSIQKELCERGIDTAVLKGLSLHRYYGALGCLRQCGDIDLWALPQSGETYKARFMRIMSCFGVSGNFTRQHVQVPNYEGFCVEMHFTPSVMSSAKYDTRLQRWFDSRSDWDSVEFKSGPVKTLSAEDNMVYVLQHCYNHFLYEGIGMRQVMDYYMILCAANECAKDNICQTLDFLGLLDFASGMMWVIKMVFHAPDSILICKPSERIGKVILEEVEAGGNFGQYGKGLVPSNKKLSFFFARIIRNARFIRYFPNEVLWLPWYMIKCFFWKRAMIQKLRVLQ